MLFWAAGFVASDAQPYGLITGAWTTLRVAHNSTSPNNKLFSYNGCSPLRLGANELISCCFFAFFDVWVTVFS